ncbi:MAG: polysaccharide deacetylase family protein, partial [Deltaproteobacteria bacterium]|nr:polysaccharide deacetylase family protein [Deltaproteobacteria bacterium]
ITALTLASWRDGFSNSLLVRTLLSGRGGEIGGLALALALDRMDNRWKRNYFRLARLTTPYPQVRLATTALLSGRMSGWRVGVIRRDLVRALDEALAGEGSAEDSLRARIAIWGLTRPGSDGCPMVLQRLDLEVAAGGDRRERVRSLVSALDGDCLLRARREASLLSTEGMAPRAGSRERRARFPLPGVAPVAAEGAMPEVLRALADRVALGDVTPSLEEIAAAAAERARGRLPTDPAWDAFTLLRHPPGERISRTSWRRLEETWQDMPVPQDFDTFDPAFLQPPWWPEGMEITIDDGPRPLRLAEVLDILAKHEVHATFFFIGSNLVSEWLQDPERLQDLLRRLLREGHAIGYHSMDHDTTFLRHLQAWLPEQVADDIELFRNVLELALGHPYPLVWARAPGGMGVRLPWLRAGLALGGLRASVPWTVDPEAWPPGISSRRVRELARTLEKKAGRTIILLHETTGLARELDAFLSELRIAREVPRTAARVR